MKNTSKIALSVLAAGAFALSASAVPITGGITMSSPGFTSDNPNLTLAHTLTLTTPVYVQADSGDFATVPVFPLPGSIVTMQNPLVVNPLTLPADPLWAVGQFSFTLSTIAIGPVSPISLTLSGVGTIHSTIPGLSDTLGTWTATFNNTAGVVFSWSDVTAAGGVPESSTTLILLGLALTSLATYAKLRKTSVA